MTKTNYFRAITVLVAVAAAVVATLLTTTTSAEAASRVFVGEVSPDGGSTNVAADSNITAVFSKAMRASTIKSSTFYLTKQGSSTTILAQVSYSPTSKTATLNPDSNLEAGATYTATIKGGKREVKASNGDRLGGTTDSTATFANGKVTWSFTVANDPPLPPPPPHDECPYMPGDQPAGTVCKEGVEITPTELRPSFSGWCSTYVLGGLWAIDAGWFIISNYTPDPVYIAEVSITGPDAQYFSSGALQYTAQQGSFELASADNVSDQLGLQTQRDFLGTREYNADITYKDENSNTLGNPVHVTATTHCSGI